MNSTTTVISPSSTITTFSNSSPPPPSSAAAAAASSRQRSQQCSSSKMHQAAPGSANNNGSGGGKSNARSPRSRYSLTYADWITRALMAAKEKCACLSDIYEWMSFNVPGLQEQRFLHSSKGWKNAVRHTLSINPRFQKLKRLGKPALWTLSEEYLRQAQALTKISMSIGGGGGGSIVDSAIDSIGQSIIRRSSLTGAGLSPPAAAAIGHRNNNSSIVDTIDLAAAATVKSEPSPVANNNNIGLSSFPNLIGGGLHQQRHNFADAYRPNFLNNDPYHHHHQQQQQASSSSSSTMTCGAGAGGNPLGGLSQACDLATRAAFLSDVSALASLNALIGGAAEPAAAAARAVTPPLVNFFNNNTSPFGSAGGAGIARRGSGDSGISIASTGSLNNGNGNAAPTGQQHQHQMHMVDSLRPFTQTLDVTTLSGLEATLLFPRPLPIQCLTDHKLLLASLIWPNPAAAAYLTN